MGATPTLNSLAGVPAPPCHTYYNATKEEGENTQRARSTSNLDIKFPPFFSEENVRTEGGGKEGRKESVTSF